MLSLEENFDLVEEYMMGYDKASVWYLIGYRIGAKQVVHGVGGTPPTGFWEAYEMGFKDGENDAKKV